MSIAVVISQHEYEKEYNVENNSPDLTQEFPADNPHELAIRQIREAGVTCLAEIPGYAS